jgi:hypothetical protein
MNRRKVLKSVAGIPLLPTIRLSDTDLTDSYTVVESHYKKIVREWRHSRKVVYLTYRDVQDDIVSVVYKTPQTLTVYSYNAESRTEASRVFKQVQENNFDTESLDLQSKQVIQRDNQ